jgi:transcription factor SPN1
MLDALSTHVLTPFIGPVPPSNLLNKIARGVGQAKGPSDWPYSLRSTHAKLVELCRARAKEVSAKQGDVLQHH